MRRVVVFLFIVLACAVCYADEHSVVVLEPADKSNLLSQPIRENLQKYLSESISALDGYTAIATNTVKTASHTQIHGSLSSQIKNIASRENARYVLTTEIDKYDSLHIFVLATLYNGLSAEKQLWANIITPTEDSVLRQNCSLLIGNILGDGAIGGATASIQFQNSSYDGPSAMELYGLGSQYYLNGNYPKAVEFFRQAAEAGNDSAQYMLAECLFYGWGTECNREEAIVWFHRVAVKGDIDAQYSLGYCYYYGVGAEVDYRSAFKWLSMASAMEHREAKALLAECHYYGKGTTQDYEAALALYLDLAKRDVADAQYSVGFCYFHGLGAPCDYYEAVLWLCKAAIHRHTKAEVMLAECWFEGKGIIPDKRAALDALRKLANEGYADAQYALGYYLQSESTPMYDKKEACEWLGKAAGQGHEGAKDLLKKIKAAVAV